ncbi:MAG: SGNH/GDSL hydrolase family protein [Ruminococcaceae bacterium]|nr:SGNH/GDSL hydrolase family protein [Oscillospiraceae bacterium]
MVDLTLPQIQSITMGALDIREDADGFHFFRALPVQVEAFGAANPEFLLKIACTSGIRLDFYTDSSLLAMRWCNTKLSSARTFSYFDVLVDGVLMLHSGTMDCVVQPNGSFCLTLPEGMHRVQIFLPLLTDVTVSAVTLAEGATVMPYRAGKRILFHGDSITQGYDALFSSCNYANRLARYYDAEILNQAVGAACFNPEVLQYVGEFDFVVVAYGTNDWRGKTMAQISADTAGFFARLQTIYGHLPVFVILPIWRTDINDGEFCAGDFMECRALIGRLATAHGFHALDDYDLLPHDTRLFSDGYLHPNDIGFDLYAQRLCQMIDEKLNR